MKDEIRALADRYAAELKRSIDERVVAMEQDDRAPAELVDLLRRILREYDSALERI